MTDDLLNLMRQLRREAESLSETLVEDHQRYRHPAEGGITFFRLPSDRPKPDQINVTPTSTGWMALSLAAKWNEFASDPQATIIDQVKRIFEREEWDTGRLLPNNAFTAAIVLRACGLLCLAGAINREDLSKLCRQHSDKEKDAKTGRDIDIADDARQFHGRSPEEVLSVILKNAPTSFALSNYPPTPAIAYWLCDAAALLKVPFDDDASKLVNWAAREFSRQVSFVAANDRTLLDPVAMAMAACLCRLIQRLVRLPENQQLGKAVREEFVTDNELRSAIQRFFAAQNDAGVWEKYFPLFHYPAAGANHCWHFEVLEAILQEFPEEVVTERGILSRLGQSVQWLKENRLEFSTGQQIFYGWNSGGEAQIVRRGEPESWPTGVAHMFLHRLRAALSDAIRDRVLQKYKNRVRRNRNIDKSAWEDCLDCRLPESFSVHGMYRSVKDLLKNELLDPAEKTADEHAELTAPTVSNAGPLDRRRRIRPNFRLTRCVSALLFGPPGTSKTSVAKAVSKYLGWPFVELSPSDFLRGGLPGIHDRVNEVFEDLMDLFGVVILFDEMDALVQSREGEGTGGALGATQLDVTQQFLTTSLLPKLQELHEMRRVIFFMATNHQRAFDAAIKRPGRFDLLLRMGPPSFDEKKRGLKIGLAQWLREETSLEDSHAIFERFDVLSKPKCVNDSLELFTFGEMTELFDELRRGAADHKLKTALQGISEDDFAEVVNRKATDEITLRPGSNVREEFDEVDAKAIRIQPS